MPSIPAVAQTFSKKKVKLPMGKISMTDKLNMLMGKDYGVAPGGNLNIMGAKNFNEQKITETDDHKDLEKHTDRGTWLRAVSLAHKVTRGEKPGELWAHHHGVSVGHWHGDRVQQGWVAKNWPIKEGFINERDMENYQPGCSVKISSGTCSQHPELMGHKLTMVAPNSHNLPTHSIVQDERGEHHYIPHDHLEPYHVTPTKQDTRESYVAESIDPHTTLKSFNTYHKLVKTAKSGAVGSADAHGKALRIYHQLEKEHGGAFAHHIHQASIAHVYGNQNLSKEHFDKAEKAFYKHHNLPSIGEETINELNNKTLGSYIKKASHDRVHKNAIGNALIRLNVKNPSIETSKKAWNSFAKADKRRAGIHLAADKLVNNTNFHDPRNTPHYVPGYGGKTAVREASFEQKKAPGDRGWPKHSNPDDEEFSTWEGSPKSKDNTSMGVSVEHVVTEKLSSDATASDYIHDFVHSKNKRFKGDTKAKRIKRALGAYYHNKQQNEENILEVSHKELLAHHQNMVNHYSTILNDIEQKAKESNHYSKEKFSDAALKHQWHKQQLQQLQQLHKK